MGRHRIEILYQDEGVVAVNKPPGVSVTADRTGAADLLERLVSEHPEWGDLRLVHRLDKDTSGAMVLARGREAQSALSRAFAKRQVRKTYLALVSGRPARDRGRIGQPISRSRRNPRCMRIDPRRGKPAVTEYEVLADFGFVSLLAVRPETGRTHQIRVHLAGAGLPLAIDPVYGSDQPILLSQFKAGYRGKSGQEERPLIDRLTLHSYSLEFCEADESEGPPACRRMIVALLERKFAATVKMLTKHGPRGREAFAEPDVFERLLAGEPLGV